MRPPARSRSNVRRARRRHLRRRPRPASVFTLTPAVSAASSTTCTVTVTAARSRMPTRTIRPTRWQSDFTFSFTTAGPPPPVATNVLINELDSDTPGTDAAEFVELYDGGAGGTALDGLVVVFYNGSNDLSYAAFDLDGFHTNASGYFTLGNPGVPASISSSTRTSAAERRGRGRALRRQRGRTSPPAPPSPRRISRTPSSTARRCGRSRACWRC